MKEGGKEVLDTTLQTTNYQWHLSHNIRQSIACLDDIRKQHLLDNIRMKKLCCSLQEQDYNTEVCQYIESLLQNERPKNSLARATKGGKQC